MDYFMLDAIFFIRRIKSGAAAANPTPIELLRGTGPNLPPYPLEVECIRCESHSQFQIYNHNKPQQRRQQQP